MNLGNSLFHARKKCGLSQEDVAEKLGVSRQTVSKWETDETVPDIYQSKKMAVLYNMSLDELIDFDIDINEIQEIIDKTSEEVEEKIDWTNAWGKKYPILLRYQSEVNHPNYARRLCVMLDELKQEYEQIPVSPHAKERILAGIAQGKAATAVQSHSTKSGERKKKSHIIYILRNTGATAAAAMAALVILTNVNPTIANAMENVPILGPISKIVTFRTYENQTNHFEAKVDVPEIESAPAEVNQSIEEYANALIAQYESDLRSSQGEGNYSLTSSYQVVTDTPNYLCLRIDTTLVMASGTEYTKVFTVDKRTGKMISLSDLFRNKPEMLTAISDNIKEQMQAQMAADSSVTYFYNSDMPEWDFKELRGDESFYFNEKGELVITFDETDVAPAYMGAVEFAIPQSVTGTLE